MPRGHVPNTDPCPSVKPQTFYRVAHRVNTDPPKPHTSIFGSTSMSLQNCRFKFRCNQSWNLLLRTEDPDLRYCTECERGVHFCTTDAQLAEAVRLGRCVAIPQNLEGAKTQESPRHKRRRGFATVGMVFPEWGEDEE